ncbi:MAG: DEAD/DEAH box helicase family protein [Microbacteriaceae bacterium]|nr:DEAD/DEAH box helicase family protein [Microbacteriaceae bacterium]
MSDWLPYDSFLTQEVASEMDLRRPNEAALSRVAEAIAAGDGREVVCDLATGVGKTYLAASLIDYAARQGVRNVLIVVPGRTILEKTIGNFTPGAGKYIPGAAIEPLIITAENFQRGQIGDALHDANRLKVFIFTVQVLLRPTEKTSRRTRSDDEFIGGALYDHLRDADDLLVIADEHHVYRERARAFSDALRDLRPRALVGLTATPDDADRAKIVYRYSLAEAIRDELVKVPVIVYREDGLKDEDTQLADACRLRADKEPVWHGYADASERPRVSPVLFVVCKEIKDAERVAERLAGPDLLPGDGAVLLVTSQSSDDALAALARVEAPDSPVRAIVSVNKLREGWDVRNIGVIVGLRALASETLTEQVLGRGLRLPFGARTGFGAIDQVDLVAHESYRQLLANKDALLQRLTTESPGAPGMAGGMLPPGPSATVVEAPGGGFLLTTPSAASSPSPLGADAPFVLAAPVDAAEQAFERERAAVGRLMRPRDGAPVITFPRRERVLQPVPFSVASIDVSELRGAGRRFSANLDVPLTRRALAAQQGLDGAVAHIVDVAAEGAVATQRWVPGAQVRRDLVARVSAMPQVASTFDERAHVLTAVDAFLEGAGVEDGDTTDWTAPRAAAAEAALAALVDAARLRTQRQPQYRWVHVRVTGERPEPPLVLDRWAPFAKDAWYGPWDKSIVPNARFDSNTGEFALAQRIDVSDGVRWWQRVYVPGDIAIATETDGQYFPDFIVIDTRGVHWLVEAKSDSAAEDDAKVARKAAAAEAWAAAVREARIFGEWRYLLVTESDIKASPTWEALVRRVTG